MNEQKIGSSLKKLLEQTGLATIPINLKKSFEAVELTQEEHDNAILQAKIDKYYILEDDRKRKERLAQVAEFARPWTYEEMKEAAKTRAKYLASITGKEYQFDKYIVPVFKMLISYFIGDPAFESMGENFSLKKGILMCGPVGVGKTDLLRSFEFNKRMCFQTITTNEICGRIMDEGKTYWTTYTGYIPGHGKTPKYFLQENIGWMFDDIGIEDPVKDYGNPIDPFPIILHERYKMKTHIPFNSLHGTTMLSPKEFGERYGNFTQSRVREMFNIITLEGIDRRQ